jgi:biotin carboxyl carrier protein
MRYRIWAMIGFAMLLVVAVSCVGGRSAQESVGTRVPTKTLRPTFTHTPARPTEVWPTATPTTPAVPTPAPEATQAEPTPTLEPTAEPPTATPEPAAFTVTSATVNVRSGPGTSYSRIGQLKAGQSYEIIGKNDTGDWWQFSFNGDAAWVAAQMVQASGAEAVEVAANIPALPTAVKRQPAAAPKPAAPPPTAVPAPTYRFVARGAPGMLYNPNEWITVSCRVTPASDISQGIAGTIRVTGPGLGAPIEKAFGTPINRANTGMDEANQYLYNENCKVEIRPPVDGTYTAVLIENGQPISEPINFTVSGAAREWVVRWQPR